MFSYMDYKDSGKTHWAVRKAYYNGLTIVCEDEYQVECVKDIAEELNLKIEEPITFQGWLDDVQDGGYRYKEYLMDNMYNILGEFNVVGFTNRPE